MTQRQHTIEMAIIPLQDAFDVLEEKNKHVLSNQVIMEAKDGLRRQVMWTELVE